MNEMLNQRLVIACVIPVYNSSSTLREACKMIMQISNNTDFIINIVLVDDFSKDDSREIIETLVQEYPDIVFSVYLNKNVGQHLATLCGFLVAKGDFIVSIDDDMQYSPNDITKLVKLSKNLSGYVVYGIPIVKNGVSKFRIFAAKTLQNFAGLLGHERKVCSSFRCVSKETAIQISNSARKFTNIDEIIKEGNIPGAHIDINHTSGIRKGSRYTFSKLVWFVISSALTYTYYLQFLIGVILFVFFVLIISFYANPLYLLLTNFVFFGAIIFYFYLRRIVLRKRINIRKYFR